MNPEPSEIESLLKTPATLPLRSNTAPPKAPSEMPENADEAPGEIGEEEVTGEVASKDAAFSDIASTDVAPDDAVSNVALIVEPEAHIQESDSLETGLQSEATEDSALAVTFSPPPNAVFQSSLTLGVVCASPSAQIRYSLGSASVDEHGMLFDPKEKIFLTQTTLVAARAFENGVAGPIASAKFEIKKPQWEELEPADQSDATPHKIGEVLPCPDGWQLAAGSVRGKLHAHRALWREDSFALDNIEVANGVWSVIAVSDGAGSAPLSRVGSRLACQAVLKSLRASLGEIKELATEQEGLVAQNLPVLREALIASGKAALDAIRDEAQAREKPLTAFAATLLVLVRREWNGSQLCAGLQIGDGAIALVDPNGLTLLGEADHGAHSSETRFLTTGGIEDDLASRIKFSIKNDLVALAVMSDGVSDDYFPEDKRLGEVFNSVLPLVQEGDAGAALVKWLGYEKKGSSDDRTLVLGWPAASPLQTEATDGEIKAADGHAG